MAVSSSSLGLLGQLPGKKNLEGHCCSNPDKEETRNFYSPFSTEAKGDRIGWDTTVNDKMP